MTVATKTKDAVALLKADHKQVKKLFDAFEDEKDESRKREIAREAIKELKIHSAIEEEIFYPAVRKALGDEHEIVTEAQEEHRVAKTIIEDLEKGGHGEAFEAKFIVLAENVRHHIKEEEGEMFSDAKDADVDLDALGEQMAARKEELMADESALETAVAESKVKPYQELA